MADKILISSLFLEGHDNGKNLSAVAACRPISTMFKAEFVMVVSHQSEN